MTTQQTRRSPFNRGTRGPLVAGWTLLLIGSILLAPGCSWGKKSNQPDVTGATNSDSGSWLCEAGKATDDWDCIQSENIEPQLAARNKAAAEAKEQTPAPSDTTVTETIDTISDTLRDNLDAEDGPLPQNLPTVPQPIMDQGAAYKTSSEDRPLTTSTAQRPAEPEYAQLAYRPDEPVRIIDLPENFYAAQLLAVSTKKQIEDFVVSQNLYNMSAARIEQNNQVLYVLLLGVYESKAIAQRAVASMPAPVRDLKPWVRPIEGLQDAMMRGDRLAATAGIR